MCGLHVATDASRLDFSPLPDFSVPTAVDFQSITTARLNSFLHHRRAHSEQHAEIISLSVPGVQIPSVQAYVALLASINEVTKDFKTHPGQCQVYFVLSLPRRACSCLPE